MAQRNRYAPAAAADVAPRALTVAGIGLVVEQTPAYALWRQVEEAAGRRIGFPPPSGSLSSCLHKAELFRALAIGGALRHWSVDGRQVQTYVECHALPSYVTIPTRPQPFEAWAEPTMRRLRYRALKNGASLPFHDIDPAQSTLWACTENDLSWTGIFERFDAAGDMHSLLLFAEDGYAIRSETGQWSSAQSSRGEEPLERIFSRDKVRGDLSEAFASLLLLRRSAAERLREWSLHFSEGSTTVRHANGLQSRSAYVAGTFAPYASDPATGIGYRAPGRFTPTPFAPQPWSRTQMAQYDGMPTLAWVFRPQLARYRDLDKTLAPPAERARLLRQAIDAAVKVQLGGHPPTRIFHDAGIGEAAGARTAVLAQALGDALPQLRWRDPRVGYDLSERLGDTGAASAFVGVGLASLAAWESGGTALVVNLRRESGASVLGVCAAQDNYRKAFKIRPYESGI